jgi:molybdopterin-containing oxidoreductase family iron-sulfur binding subunit
MGNDTLTTMQDDLKRALAKPPAERRWAMLIDLRKCVGCHGCTVGCVSEHKLPPDVAYRPVFEYETGAYPFVGRTFLPRPCMQCDQPSCVPVCPEHATRKATTGVAAGVVVIDYGECEGCGRCVRACPYGARTVGEEHARWSSEHARQPWETAKAWEYGRVVNGAEHEEEVARKCHFCTTRLGEGLLPVCVTTCIGRATYFGDENDPAALVAQVKSANQARLQILKPGAGTQPRCYYIANENLEALHG